MVVTEVRRTETCKKIQVLLPAVVPEPDVLRAHEHAPVAEEAEELHERGIHEPGVARGDRGKLDHVPKVPPDRLPSLSIGKCNKPHSTIFWKIVVISNYGRGDSLPAACSSRHIDHRPLALPRAEARGLLAPGRLAAGQRDDGAHHGRRPEPRRAAGSAHRRPRDRAPE